MNPKQFLISILVAVNLSCFFLWLYFPLLSAGYVWDDLVLLRNAVAEGQQIASQPGLFVGTNFFRPIGYLSFLLEVRFWGVSPLISHAINIVLQIVLICLVFSLLMVVFRWSASFWARLFASLVIVISLFATPFMAEPVAWVSARFEILCGIFVVLTLLSGLLVSATWLRLLLVGVFFLSALLAKESAIGLLLALPMLYLLTESGNLRRPVCSVVMRRALILLGALLAVLLIYAILRFAAASSSEAGVNTLASLNLLQHFRLVAESIAQYLSLSLWPWQQLMPMYTADFKNPLGLSVIFAVSALMLLVAFGGWYFVRRRECLTLIPFIYISMIGPAINLIPIYPGFYSVTPRYLFIPFIVVATAIALWLAGLNSKRPRLFRCVLLVFALTVWPSASSTRTFIAIYDTNESFWDALIKNYGIFHHVVAINGVTSKSGAFKYEEALKRLESVRGQFDIDEDLYLRIRLNLQYSLGEYDDLSSTEIESRVEEIGVGGRLLEKTLERHAFLDAFWLDYFVTNSIARCNFSASVQSAMKQSMFLKLDYTTKILFAAFSDPWIFYQAGYDISALDPFKQEAAKEMIRLLRRDIEHCGSDKIWNVH